jgi:hypothetical protein
MLRPLAGRNPAPPACGVSWAGPLARLEVVFHFFHPVFLICAGFFFYVFFQDFGSAGFLLILILYILFFVLFFENYEHFLFYCF